MYLCRLAYGYSSTSFILWHFEFGKSRLESVFRFASVATRHYYVTIMQTFYYPIDNLVSEAVIVFYFYYILLVLHICIANSQ